jgi:hypothetical protein
MTTSAHTRRTDRQLNQSSHESDIKGEKRKTDLFDHDDVRLESRRDLGGNLVDEGVVLHRLPRLHHTDDGRLDHVLSVLVDVLEKLDRLGLLLGFDGHVEVDSDLQANQKEGKEVGQSDSEGQEEGKEGATN